MALTFSLAPEPMWVLINSVGTTAGGGYIVTRRSLNKVQDKPIFMDPGGEEAWPNPTYFGLNGVQGPFYWEVDSSAPNDTYWVQAYDAQNNLLWDVDNFDPTGSGGGGNVTVYIPIQNYIANNVFIDHSDPISVATDVTNYVLAPSNHKGFTPALINPVLTAYGYVGPDIRFNKNETSQATDQITFPQFSLGETPLSGDVTPVHYVRYQCTGTPTGEMFKNFQFPVCQKVQNLSNKAVTFSLWAAVTTTPVTITAYVMQYFGSGTAASAPLRTEITAITLSTTWTQTVINFVMPDVSPYSLGTPGKQTDDDAIYIQLDMPFGNPADVKFTKPALYLGTINANSNFETYDQINSIDSTPRTGDIRTSLSSAAPNGWVPMDDGSIGNINSGATTRAAADTFQLYKTIWDGVSNTDAPLQNSSGVPLGSRGASAIADFIANNRLVLPLSLGRAIAGAGSGAGLTPRLLGDNTGAETVSLTGSNLPVGTPFNTVNSTDGVISGGSPTHVPISTNAYTQGMNVPVSIMQPTSFFNVFIKL